MASEQPAIELFVTCGSNKGDGEEDVGKNNRDVESMEEEAEENEEVEEELDEYEYGEEYEDKCDKEEGDG